MFPVRLSMITLNLWGTKRWPDRAPALRQFVELFRPDVMCVQELTRETQSFLDGILPQHARVSDNFPGWTDEGNIYWDNDFWREMEHGAEDIGFKEGNRRLFWVRLQLREHDKSIFLSTAHFTAQTHQEEIDSGVSPRLLHTRKTIEALTRLVNNNEAAFFMGDLNDPVLPTRLLHGAGFISCFSALGLQSPPTWKCYPTANVNAGTPVISEAIDWILANPRARALAALVPKCFYGDMAPSDHWPVQAVYEV